jgi:DNA-binding LacI/PurR family transcriptional regulator/DNA-binding transcriptional regulator YhcF (GntR family)
MEKMPTPLEKARSVVQQAIEKARTRNQTRLPSILHLAKTAGVAHETMRRAVAQLREEKKLEVKRSAGITIPGGFSEQTLARPPDHAELRWQRVGKELYRDLINGAFGYHDPLPSRKELGNRYAASRMTVDKALRALHASGALVRHRKSYLLAHASPKSKQDTIILFARTSMQGQLSRLLARVDEYYLALEKVCLARNVQLQVVRCYTRESRFVFDEYNRDSFTNAVDIKRVLGFIIWRIGLDATFPLWLTEWVSRFARPIAYYFDVRVPNAVLPSTESGLVRCYGVESNFEAGRSMGQYLLAKGHRRIACFYDLTGPGPGWQFERMDGLRSAFAQGGVPDGVVLRQGIDRTMPTMEEKLKTTTLFSLLQREEHVRYRKNPSIDLYTTVYYHATRERVSQSMAPLMKETAGDRSITAWVGINDEIALACARFLWGSGIPVPDRVSVAGFDNSLDATAMQMSSYDFNGAGAMRAMVDFILRPRTAVGKPSGGPQLMKGFVHERMSTRVARPPTSCRAVVRP